MSETGFAIIGCGAVAAIHARAIAAVDGARLAAVFSRSPANAARVLALGTDGVGTDGVACDSVEQAVNRPDVDVVCVTTPSGAHLEPVLAAVRAGKHLLCEKPLEISVERIDRMLTAAARRGVHLGAVFQSRFGVGARTVRGAIEAGRLGRIVLADARVKWHRPQSYYDAGQWRGTWDLDGGGALMNQSIHAVDLLQWLVGLPESVVALASTLGHSGIEVEDTAAALLRYPDGAIGVVEGTTASYPGWAKRIEISGIDGSVILEDDRILAWDVRHPTAADERIRAASATGTGATGAGASDPMAIDIEGHRLQIEDMVETSRTGRPPSIPGAEGRRAVALIEAIYRSARTGAPATVDDGRVERTAVGPNGCRPTDTPAEGAALS